MSRPDSSTSYFTIEVTGSELVSECEPCVGTQMFSVTSASGEPDRNVTSAAAWGCFGDAQLLPRVIDPGQWVTGKIVLGVE